MATDGWETVRKKSALIFQKTGSCKEICEDRILVRETNDYAIYAIADGLSGKKYCKQGAEFALDIAAEFILDRGIEDSISYQYRDEYPGDLMKSLRKAYCDIAEKQLDCHLDDLSSTLMMICISKHTLSYIIIHIGDGGIIAVNKHGAQYFLSGPDNPVGGDFTWLTTSKCAAEHLTIKVGSAAALKRIILVTDGADMICLRGTLLYQAGQVLKDGTDSDIETFLARFQPENDATIIVVDF